VQAEYAKASPNDILIRIRIDNPRPSALDAALSSHALVPERVVMGRIGEGYGPEAFNTARQQPRFPRKPARRRTSRMRAGDAREFIFQAFGQPDRFLFTDNETNYERLFNSPNTSPYVKDAVHAT